MKRLNCDHIVTCILVSYREKAVDAVGESALLTSTGDVYD